MPTSADDCSCIPLFYYHMHLQFAKDHLAAIVRPPSSNAHFPSPRSQLGPNDSPFPLPRPSNNLGPYRSAQRTPHYRTRFVPPV